MSDLTPEMLAELRRLLDGGPLRPWTAGTVDGVDNGAVWGAVTKRNGIYVTPMIVDDVSLWPGTAELIAAAVNALPALLGAAELLAEVRDHVAHGALCPMCSTGMTRRTVGLVCPVCGTDYSRPEYARMRRDSEETSKAVLAEALAVRAERDALAAKLDAVRALHGPRVVQVLGATCSAEECDHEDACPLVDYAVCGHCYDVGDGAHPYAYEEGGLQDVAHPCATYRALDESEANK